VRLSGTLRSDRNFTLITNEPTFESPQTNTQRIGARAEYVYDNSSMRSINIYNGIRAKVFAEGMNRFRVQFADPFAIEPSNGLLGVVGTDLRYYLPVLRKSVLAARISAGTSFGDEPILYYVGGVEGSIIGTFDQSTGIPERNYSFENIAPQLRGFDRNIRNGTSYVVTTVELRVPVFRHLISDDLRYDFLREFQIVGFFDSGTAWHGASPYSPENPINSASFQSAESVFLDVQYYRDPLIVGYGVGFRTSLFGYFLKLDYATGIETKARLNPRWHFSLGTDF
jgi:outer membrane protein assembly factor BamA